MNSAGGLWGNKHGTLFAVLAAQLLFCGLPAISAGQDFSTPAQTARQLVKAVKAQDVSLWYACISDVDKQISNQMIGQRSLRELEDQKERAEQRAGGTLGKDVYEFKLGSIIAEARPAKNEPFDPFELCFIGEESVWHDRYAEVLVFLPLPVLGYGTPLRLSFIKEGGGWRLLYILTSSLFVESGQAYADLPGTVDFFIQCLTDTAVHRLADTSRRKRVFTITEELSAKYRAAWSALTGTNKNQLLLLWRLTGDPAAAAVWESEAKEGKPPFAAAVYERRLKVAAGDVEIKAPAQQSAAKPAREAKTWLEKIEGVHFLYRTVLPYQRLIAKFPADKLSCAQAQLQIAENFEYIKEYELAAPEYLKVLATYPDAREQVSLATVKLSALYREKLKLPDRETPLWKELRQAGILSDTDTQQGRPVRLIQDNEAGFSEEGILDLAPTQDSLFVLRRMRTKKADKNNSRLVTQIDLYTQDGSLTATVFSQELESYVTGMYVSGGKIYLRAPDRLLVIDRDKKLTGAVVEENHVRFAEAFEPEQGPKGKPGITGLMVIPNNQLPADTRAKPMPAHAYSVNDTVLSAFYTDKIRCFNLETGLLLREIHFSSPAPCNFRPDSVVETSTGEFVAPVAGSGAVLKIGPTGSVVPLPSPDIPADSLEHISDIYCDRSGNLYAVDQGNRRIMKYDGLGKLQGSYTHETLLEPSSVAVDDDGSLYVAGRGDGLTVLTRQGNFSRTIAMPRIAGDLRTSAIRDVEITRDALYFIVDRYVVQCSLQGEKIFAFRCPDADYYKMHLGKDKKGTVYFSSGAQLYAYAGADSRPLAPPPTGPGRDAGPDINCFGLFTDGSIVAFTSQHALCELDAAGRFKNELKLAGEKTFFSVDRFAVDATDSVWALERERILKIDRQGKQLCSIARNPSARRVWSPADAAVDSHDNMYILDAANRLVIKFSPDGRLISDFDLTPYLKGGLIRLKIDRADRLYVLSHEPDNKVIMRFTL